MRWIIVSLLLSIEISLWSHNPFTVGDLATQEEMGRLELCRKLFANYERMSDTESTYHTIPQTIHLIWLGPAYMPQGSLKRIEQLVSLHPQWTYVLWSDQKQGSPFGKEHPLKDVFCKKNILEEDLGLLESLYDRAVSVCEKARLATYHILFSYGGVCIDHDVDLTISLESFHKKCHFYSQLAPVSSKLGAPSQIVLGLHLIGACPRHPLVAQTIEDLYQNWDKRDRTLGVYARAVFPKEVERVLFFRSLYPLSQNMLSQNMEQGLNCSEYCNLVLPADFPGITHHHMMSWKEPLSKEERKIDKIFKNLYLKESKRITVLWSFVVALSLLSIFFVGVFMALRRESRR